MYYTPKHKINIMNSLRTDDILGAKPRVRHMPKNLIRERAVPTSFITNLTLSNPEFEAISQSQIHYQQEAPDSRIQYQNNDPNAYPFYARNRLTKEPRYVNYDLPREERRQAKELADINAINQSMDLSRAPSEHRYQSSSKVEKQPSQESNRSEVRRDGEEWERSRASSRRSMDNKEQREESKRIFRGLGFNIITNHKY
jgi:hypothetical protein